MKTKVRKIGNSLGVILPSSVLHAMHVREGDDLYLTESPEGLKVSPYDPEFDRAMKAAEGVMGRYRNALRELSR